MAAAGVHLDRLGKLVGEARKDRTDAAYAAAIRVRIRVNRSDGSADTLLQIAKILAVAGSIVYADSGGAKYSIGATVDPEAMNTLAEALRDADAAGVGADISIAPEGATTIRFGSSYGTAPRAYARGSKYTVSDTRTAGYSP